MPATANTKTSLRNRSSAAGRIYSESALPFVLLERKVQFSLQNHRHGLHSRHSRQLPPFLVQHTLLGRESDESLS